MNARQLRQQSIAGAAISDSFSAAIRASTASVVSTAVTEEECFFILRTPLAAVL